ncbi:MAG: acyltransferase [Sulfobacillus acidophilus]|uniref:Acyltransferase n=1 Tax=Sulfobacillus acidophilus TaxID=53633 RepID=A0A2T2WLS0_9FIRM|nr:MAG: acyltransferase [Sulfobacillus acidophilus]
MFEWEGVATTPRIAVSQGPYIRDLDAALIRCFEHLRHAASRGVDIMVFPEWFLGLNPVDVLPNRYTERISRVARELNVMVIAGSIRALEPDTGRKQQRSLVIESDGTLVGSHAKLLFHPTERPWFEPGVGVFAIASRWGRIIVLPGLDALDPEIWHSARELTPDLVVMAANPRTLSERNAAQELTIQRSQEIDGTVVLAPLLGRFSGSSYVGGALIAHQGRMLGMADDQETVLIGGDPEAPLIQLGTTDATAYLPLTPPLEGSLDVTRSMGPQAERRVLVDWGMMAATDVLNVVEELFHVIRDNPRWTALVPARPGASAHLRQWLDRGAAGAFAYPGLERHFPWSDAIRQLGRELSKTPKPLLVHSGPGPAPLRFDSPALWDEFLMEFPAVPVIFQSMGQRPPYIEQAFVLAERHPQVQLETSRVPIGAIKEALGTVGADRLLFGSGGLAQDFQQEWEKLAHLESEISPELFQKIVNLNARHLFFHVQAPDRRTQSKVRSFRLPS